MSTSRIIPCLRYRHAPEAIEWLCQSFGFEKHLVVPGENGTIAHAQLTLGDSMIMLGSVHTNPGESERSETQSSYVIIAGIDEHYARVTAAGAKIVIDLKDEDYGGRGFTCRDPEGHLWSFGSYDPWAE